MLGGDAWSCRQAGEWRRRWGDRGNRGAATRGVEDGADEYTRSLNALAITIGMDIFFRNGAYRPETEEGRKILAHELTHVAQSKKREEYRGASREELEREAEEAEEREVHDDDPIVEYSTGRNRYRMRKSEARRIERMVESELAEWVEGQERMMSEEEYLKLLYKYREYLERKA